MSSVEDPPKAGAPNPKASDRWLIGVIVVLGLIVLSSIVLLAALVAFRDTITRSLSQPYIQIPVAFAAIWFGVAFVGVRTRLLASSTASAVYHLGVVLEVLILIGVSIYLYAVFGLPSTIAALYALGDSLDRLSGWILFYGIVLVPFSLLYGCGTWAIERTARVLRFSDAELVTEMGGRVLIGAAGLAVLVVYGSTFFGNCTFYDIEYSTRLVIFGRTGPSLFLPSYLANWFGNPCGVAPIDGRAASVETVALSLAASQLTKALQENLTNAWWFWQGMVIIGGAVVVIAGALRIYEFVRRRH